MDKAFAYLLLLIFIVVGLFIDYTVKSSKAKKGFGFYYYIPLLYWLILSIAFILITIY